MMSSLFSLKSYWLLNGAIVVGFIISRFILSLSACKRNLSQKERLQFARYSFCITLILFLLMPNILIYLPSFHSNFQLMPILKNTSNFFMNPSVRTDVMVYPLKIEHSDFSFNSILLCFMIFGFLASLGKYLHNLYRLNHIRQNAFCLHRMHRIHLLFANSLDIPFCWSSLTQHFIIIPHTFLEKPQDLKWVIRHELQHIRQKDTYWLHFLILLKVFCFWNPFLRWWLNWFLELQEFSCDEAIVLRKKTLPTAYAECLLHAVFAHQETKWLQEGVLGMNGLSQSILYRRVNMLFKYNKRKTKKLTIIAAYIVSFFMMVTATYALTSSAKMQPLTKQQIDALIQQSHFDSSFQISATKEVVNEINHIRSSDRARTLMQESLKRMTEYQPTIEKALNERNMPKDLLVVPLVESGYRPLNENMNQAHAAGIWQFIPETARSFGLVINSNRDDRLNTTLSTNAALAYLKAIHTQFGNWKLALVAYEIGEGMTNSLVKETGSQNAWKLAQSAHAPDSLKAFVTRLDTMLIIMRNPSLVNYQY